MGRRGVCVDIGTVHRLALVEEGCCAELKAVERRRQSLVKAVSLNASR